MGFCHCLSRKRTRIKVKSAGFWVSGPLLALWYFVALSLRVKSQSQNGFHATSVTYNPGDGAQRRVIEQEATFTSRRQDGCFWESFTFDLVSELKLVLLLWQSKKKKKEKEKHICRIGIYIYIASYFVQHGNTRISWVMSESFQGSF